MKERDPQPQPDPAKVYRIRVRGMLDDSWSNWLDGMTITVRGDVTTMTGAVLDQALLRGVLNRIWDLNLELISVTRVAAEAEEGVFLR